MGQLGDFTIDQVAGAAALLLGSIGALRHVLQQSKCVKIKLCWGLLACNRQVPEDVSEEPEPEPEPESRP